MNTENWTINETRRLFELCDKARNEGVSLTSAFRTMAKATGRSINSVRNFYYGQSKTFDLVPEVAQKLGIKTARKKRAAFVPFETDEVDKLIENILVAKGNGKSVRAAIFELANGNERIALRLQNKYRSVLRTHRDRVETIMADLDERGIKHFDPYKKARRVDNIERLTEYISALDEERVGKFLSLLEKF